MQFVAHTVVYAPIVGLYLAAVESRVREAVRSAVEPDTMRRAA